MNRILVTDDHFLVRGGIIALLSSVLPECVFHEAGSLKEAMSVLEGASDVDLITLDLDLPDAKQLDALSELRTHYAHIPIAVLSGSRDANLARAALAAGASGFVSKLQKPEVLLTALREICECGSYASADIAPADPDEEIVRNRVAKLTPQQQNVFRLVVKGCLNKQIAHELDISLTTVKAHVSAILAKLEVPSRTLAVILAKKYLLFG